MFRLRVLNHKSQVIKTEGRSKSGYKLDRIYLPESGQNLIHVKDPNNKLVARLKMSREEWKRFTQ